MLIIDMSFLSLFNLLCEEGCTTKKRFVRIPYFFRADQKETRTYKESESTVAVYPVGDEKMAVAEFTRP